MRFLFAILGCSLGAGSLLLAGTASTTLTLVDEEGFNEVSITVGSSGVEDTDTTTLTGSTNAEFMVDPSTGRATEMTLGGGRFSATDLNFSAGIIGFAGFTATSVDPTGNTMLGGTLNTTEPPGELTPEPEEGKSSFDASQFDFTIDSGVLFIIVYIPFSAASESTFDFNMSPVTAPGEGEGTVCLTETARDATTITYDVVTIFPVAVDQTIMDPEDPDAPAIDVMASGTIKAAGSVTVSRFTAYEQWAIDNGIPGAPFDGDENGDGVKNGIQWGLGLAASSSPFPHLLRPVGDQGATVDFTVTLPPGGSAEDLTVQTSSAPGTVPFAPLASGVSGGNPIPAGTSGTVTISLPKTFGEYVQLSVQEP